jgi:hypothetical protein
MGHPGQRIIFVVAAGICERLSLRIAGSARAPTEFVQIEKGLGPDGRIAVLQFDRSDSINAMSPAALRQ